MALASSPHLTGLTRLNLGDNMITDVGAVALARSPHLGSLIELDLGGNRVDVRGAAALRARVGGDASLKWRW